MGHIVNGSISLEMLQNSTQACKQHLRGLKIRWGRKLNFSNRHLKISDRGNGGCSALQFCP